MAAAEDLLELHLCRLCRLLLRWIISRSGDQNRHRRSRSACKKKRKRDEEDAYYVPFPPPPGPKGISFMEMIINLLESFNVFVDFQRI